MIQPEQRRKRSMMADVANIDLQDKKKKLKQNLG